MPIHPLPGYSDRLECLLYTYSRRCRYLINCRSLDNNLAALEVRRSTYNLTPDNSNSLFPTSNLFAVRLVSDLAPGRAPRPCRSDDTVFDEFICWFPLIPLAHWTRIYCTRVFLSYLWNFKWKTVPYSLCPFVDSSSGQACCYNLWNIVFKWNCILGNTYKIKWIFWLS